MAEKKMTKVEKYAELVKIVEGVDVANKDELIAFLNHEKETVANRNSNSKPTSAQKANVIIMDTLRTVLAEQEEQVTITQLMEDPRLESYTMDDKKERMTNQKLSSVMKKLVDSGEVVKTMNKKKAFFKLA